MDKKQKRITLISAVAAVAVIVAAVLVWLLIFRTTFAFADNMPEKVTVNKKFVLDKYLDNPDEEYLTVKAEYEKDGKTEEYLVTDSAFTPTNLGEVKLTAMVEGTQKEVETTINVIDAAPSVTEISDIYYFHHETMVFDELLDYIHCDSLSDLKITLNKYEWRDKMVRLEDGATEFTFDELGEYLFFGTLTNDGGSIPLKVTINATLDLTDNEKDDLTNTVVRTNYGTLDYSKEIHSENSDWSWVLKADPTKTYAASYENGDYKNGKRLNADYWWNRFEIDFDTEVDPAKMYYTIDYKLNKNVGQIRFEYLDTAGQVFGLKDFHYTGDEWQSFSTESIFEGKIATRMRITIFHPADTDDNFTTYDPEDIVAWIDNCHLHERTEEQIAAMKNEDKDFTNDVKKLEGGGTIQTTTEHAPGSAYGQQLKAGWWCTEESIVFYRNLFHIDLGKTIDLSTSYFTMNVKLSKDAGQFRYDLLDKEGKSLVTVDMDNTSDGWVSISSKDYATEGLATTLKITLMHPRSTASNFKGYDPNNVIAVIDNGKWHTRTKSEIETIQAQNAAEKKDLTNTLYKPDGGIVLNGKSREHAEGSTWSQEVTAAWWCTQESNVFYRNFFHIDLGEGIDLSKQYITMDARLTEDAGQLRYDLLDAEGKSLVTVDTNNTGTHWMNLSSKDKATEGIAKTLKVTLMHPNSTAANYTTYDAHNVKAFVDNCYIHDRSAEEVAVIQAQNAAEQKDLTNVLYKDGGGMTLNGKQTEKAADSSWSQGITAAHWHTSDSGLLSASYVFIDFGREVDLLKEYFSIDVKMNDNVGDIVLSLLDEDNNKVGSWITSSEKGQWVTLSSRNITFSGKAVRMRICLQHPHDNNAEYDAHNVKAWLDNCYLQERTAEEIAGIQSEKNDLSNNFYKSGLITITQKNVTEEHAVNSFWSQEITAHPDTNYENSGFYNNNYGYIDLGDGVDLSQNRVSLDVKLSADAGYIVMSFLDADGKRLESTWVTAEEKDQWITLSSKDKATSGIAKQIKITLSHPAVAGSTHDVNNVKAWIDNCFVTEISQEELHAKAEEKDMSNSIYKDGGFITINPDNITTDKSSNSYWSRKIVAHPETTMSSPSKYNNYVWIDFGSGVDLSKNYVDFDAKLSSNTAQLVVQFFDANGTEITKNSWLTTTTQGEWVTVSSKTAYTAGTAVKMKIRIDHPAVGVTYDVNDVTALLDNCYIYARPQDEIAQSAEKSDLSNSIYKDGGFITINPDNITTDKSSNSYWSRKIVAHPETTMSSPSKYNNYVWIDFGSGVDLSKNYVDFDAKLSSNTAQLVVQFFDANGTEITKNSWLTTTTQGEWVTVSSKTAYTAGTAVKMKIRIDHPAVGVTYDVNDVTALLDNCYIRTRTTE